MEVGTIQRERDLFRRVLDLGTANEIEPFLSDALALMAETAGARCGYIELYDEPREAEEDGARFSMARGCSDGQIEEIRARLSRGVIAEALATGKTVNSASALLDPRFRERKSVQRNQIEAVLCVPVGSDPPFGVLYLQDRLSSGPFSEHDRLRSETVARHIATFADRLLMKHRRDEDADATLAIRKKLRLDAVVGRSVALARMLKHVAIAASVDAGVLLTGPSGSGKTQIARVIHENGPRSNAPFVELNCANLAESLFESELFGAVPGAHSTATRRMDGKVAAAQGGTLFLDEIGDVPLASQAKLLKLLDSKEYFALGSSRLVRSDARVIAATNVDLKAAVARRQFREDLFYRLQILPIQVPSLAERREDIPLLVRHFCRRFSDVHQLRSIEPSPGALRAAQAAEWQGNIREVANAVQRAVLIASVENALQIERRHLFTEDGSPTVPPKRLTFQKATQKFQAQLLVDTLEETGWNVAEAATLLDLTRSHVYNLIHAFGLSRP
jgi:Nif-specific regulatory protein